MGRRPTKIYVIGSECFLPSGIGHFWIRTHWSAAFVDCPVCNAKAGGPCHDARGDGRLVAYTHYQRRTAHRRMTPGEHWKRGQTIVMSGVDRMATPRPLPRDLRGY